MTTDDAPGLAEPAPRRPPTPPVAVFHHDSWPAPAVYDVVVLRPYRTSRTRAPGSDPTLTWIGLALAAAPTGVPRPAIDRMSAEIAKALKQPDVRERLVQLGNDPLGTTPEEAAARIKREFPRFAKAIKAANIKAD